MTTRLKPSCFSTNATKIHHPLVHDLSRCRVFNVFREKSDELKQLRMKGRFYNASKKLRQIDLKILTKFRYNL